MVAVWQQLVLAAVALRTAGAPTAAPSGGASKHIDWYCGECDPRYLNTSYPTSHPELLDGIMPCCGGGCHPNGGPCWGLSINCTSGQIDVARHNLSAYAPFLRAGKTVNVDLSGEAACCASETDCTILENKEALAAQVLEIALLYNLSGFTMDWVRARPLASIFYLWAAFLPGGSWGYRSSGSPSTGTGTIRR